MVVKTMVTDFQEYLRKKVNLYGRQEIAKTLGLTTFFIDRWLSGQSAPTQAVELLIRKVIEERAVRPRVDNTNWTDQ